MNPGQIRRDRIRLTGGPAMKKTVTIILTMLTFASAWAQQKPKLAEMILDKDGSWLSVSGVWRPDNPTKKNELVEAVTELSCYRHGGKELVGTEAFCLQVMALSPDGLLDVSTD